MPRFLALPALKRFQNPRQLIRIHTGPVIHHVHGLFRHQDGDIARTAVVDGIAHQIGQHDGQRHFRAVHGQQGRLANLQANLLAVRQRAEALHQVDCQVVDDHVLAVRLALLRARQHQQRFQRCLHVLHSIFHAADQGAITDLADQQFQVGTKHCQWRAQLVTGITGKLPFALHKAHQPVRIGIQRRHQHRHFAVGIRINTTEIRPCNTGVFHRGMP